MVRGLEYQRHRDLALLTVAHRQEGQRLFSQPKVSQKVKKNNKKKHYPTTVYHPYAFYFLIWNEEAF